MKFPKMWCTECRAPHTASIPYETYACKKCRFTTWYESEANTHRKILHTHEIYIQTHTLEKLGNQK